MNEWDELQGHTHKHQAANGGHFRRRRFAYRDGALSGAADGAETAADDLELRQTVAQISKLVGQSQTSAAQRPAVETLSLRAFLASEGLDDLYDPLHELGAELLSDLADVTDAEFIDSGITLEKGKWLRSQAQAARSGGSGGGDGAAGIPEGVPKEDDGV